MKLLVILFLIYVCAQASAYENQGRALYPILSDLGVR